jgi:hypothetical protein
MTTQGKDHGSVYTRTPAESLGVSGQLHSRQ